MNMRRSILISCAFLLTAYFSCSEPYSVKTELVNFLNDGHGFRRFYADVPGHFDRSFWLVLNASSRTTMDTVETQLSKVSGSSSVGSGILFCFKDGGNFYLLTIFTDGGYAVDKRVKDVYTNIIPKTVTDKLTPGYDVVNDVMVIYDTGEKKFSIYFNGSFVNSFIDSTYSGGKSGYWATIGREDQEHFPDQPVDVRFKEIKPVTDP